MEGITIIEGADLRTLFTTLGVQARDRDVYRVRIWQASDGSGVKVKVNERTWTPALGEKDA